MKNMPFTELKHLSGIEEIRDAIKSLKKLSQ
jgi:hypothetical protein